MAHGVSSVDVTLISQGTSLCYHSRIFKNLRENKHQHSSSRLLLVSSCFPIRSPNARTWHLAFPHPYLDHRPSIRPSKGLDRNPQPAAARDASTAHLLQETKDGPGQGHEPGPLHPTAREARGSRGRAAGDFGGLKKEAFEAAA